MVVRDASTLMLVREGPGHPEVLLLQRNPRSEFVGGAHVFPGGAVDPADRAATVERLCVGRTDAECSARLGLDRGGLAFWVAAVRECFEEAGVLLARRCRDQQLISFVDPAVARRFVAHRAAVNAGRRLADVLVEEDLVIDAGLLHPVSRWVTPEGAPRRYDTWFFVAAAPPGQVPLHDDGEAVASTWIEPDDALARQRQGRLDLVLPTIRNLEALRPFATVDAVLEAARAVEDVPIVRPRLVNDGAGVRVVLPGEAGYDSAPVP